MSFDPINDGNKPTILDEETYLKFLNTTERLSLLEENLIKLKEEHKRVKERLSKDLDDSDIAESIRMKEVHIQNSEDDLKNLREESISVNSKIRKIIQSSEKRPIIYRYIQGSTMHVSTFKIKEEKVIREAKIENL